MTADAPVLNVEQLLANSVLLTSREQHWQGIEVMQARLNFNGFNVPPLASHTIALNLGQPFHLAAKINGRPADGLMESGNCKIVPAGADSEWQWTENTSLNMLHLSLTDVFVKEVINGVELNPDTIEVVSRVGVNDAQIKQIGLTLLSELSTGGLGGRIYAESLTNILAVHLLRYYSSKTKPELIKNFEGPLSKQSLKLVTEYIYANLDQDLRLAEIAAIVNLSSYHFSRLFKQSAGYSPHQYIIKCRVEQAKVLLLTTNLSLQQIAYKVGFVDQSHLTRHFRHYFGVPPTTMRKNS